MHLTPVEVTSYKSKSFCNRKNKLKKKMLPIQDNEDRNAQKE